MCHGIVLIILLLAMTVSLPLHAALVVSIGKGADGDALFWVESSSHYGLLHGGYTKRLDARLLRAGETAHIPVLMLNPVTFTFVHTWIYHPAYLYEGKQVGEMPSAIRDVTIPEFEPRSWRAFIDAGEKVLHAGQGIHLGNVIDHFNLFIKSYLPAIDTAGGGDRLGVYLPLFEDIIRHTEETLPQTTYGSKSIDEQRRQDPDYARRLDQTEQRRLGELHDLLAEIKTLLSVSAQERIRLRTLQAKFVDAGSVYHELMAAQDRQQVEEFLDLQHENHHARPDRTRQWLSDDGQIRYAITLGDHYSLRGKDSRPLYDNCYRTGLNVDLYAGKPTALKDTQKRLTASFCRSERGEWLIQLPQR